MSIVPLGDSGAQAFIDPNTRAMHANFRAMDFTKQGSFALGITSGVMAASLPAPSSVFEFRNGGIASTVATGTTSGQGVGLILLKYLSITVFGNTVAWAAGTISFEVWSRRRCTTSATGWTTVSVIDPNCKLRSGMRPSTLHDIRISNTAALTQGSGVNDSRALASIQGAVAATASLNIFPPTSLIEQRAGEAPLILGPSEAIQIRASVPGTGTWGFSVNARWDEVEAL